MVGASNWVDAIVHRVIKNSAVNKTDHYDLGSLRKARVQAHNSINEVLFVLFGVVSGGGSAGAHVIADHSQKEQEGLLRQGGEVAITRENVKETVISIH